MRIISVLTVAVIALTAAAAQTAKPLSAFDQQLIEQQKQFLQATDARNASAADRAIADDFQGIGTNGDFYDRSEILDSAREGKPQETRAYDFRVFKLNDDSAVVSYNLIMPGQHPRYRHMSDTWARIDGRWKLKFRQITPNLWSANDLD
jgi:hypothetical protein